MVLQWLDLHHLIRPSWIIRMVRNQLGDGGWQARNMPPIGQSNQHTTIVTLAAFNTPNGPVNASTTTPPTNAATGMTPHVTVRNAA